MVKAIFLLPYACEHGENLCRVPSLGSSEWGLRPHRTPDLPKSLTKKSTRDNDSRPPRPCLLATGLSTPNQPSIDDNVKQLCGTKVDTGTVNHVLGFLPQEMHNRACAFLPRYRNCRGIEAVVGAPVKKRGIGQLNISVRRGGEACLGKHRVIGANKPQRFAVFLKSCHHLLSAREWFSLGRGSA